MTPCAQIQRSRSGCFCDLSQGWDLHECYTVTEKSLGVGGCGTVYLGGFVRERVRGRDAFSALIPHASKQASKKPVRSTNHLTFTPL